MSRFARPHSGGLFDVPRARASSVDDALLPYDAICYAFEPQNFFRHAVSPKRLQVGINLYCGWNKKIGNYVYYRMAPVFNDLG